MSGAFAGKTIVVTGSGKQKGLGQGILQAFADEGANCVVSDLAIDAEATSVAEDLRARRAAVATIACDVSKADQCRALVAQTVNRFGAVDILVNNAGIGVAGNIETCDFADWQRCFDINVNSIFHGCQKALPLMREHAPGSIINISSIAGLIASDTMPAYNASKAAVWMLSKSIALHCAKKNMNIRCNSVHPTFVDTPILDGTAKAASLDKNVLLEKLARQIPLKFVGEPNDIANAVLYLASDESRFMTGAELKLDGGISAM